ncbi:MAG: hypothetical protein KUG61_10385 [Parvibaculaceae bacterium]|nr:hypothetical protein [Parvibaculaceae bacterium]
MVIFRILGLILVVFALMALGADGIQSLEAGELSLRSTTELWTLLNAASLEAFSAWVAGLPAFVQDPIVSSLLSIPVWVTLGVLGLLIAFLFRKRD